MRTLDTSCPLVVGSAGVGGTPGPSQWKYGVPVTPVGRVTEQVRVTVSPAMTEEEGEEVREMTVRLWREEVVTGLWEADTYIEHFMKPRSSNTNLQNQEHNGHDYNSNTETHNLLR